METNMFCSIMNRIRKTADKSGSGYDEISVSFSLTNGKTVVVMLNDYDLLDGYIEAWTQNESFCYIPIKNIVSINV